MENDLNQVPLIIRREIEARIAGPLIQAYSEEIGKERALAVARNVIKKLALEHGAHLAKISGGNGIADLAEAGKVFSSGNAHRKVILAETESKRDYNVTRCAYADMYKELGMADLGYVLSCGRDFEMIKGFNPRMILRRTKTIMEGEDFCDFRITLE